jgi:hypothetical protein
MSAAAWFFISAILFALGAYLSIFTVTTYKGMHARVAFSFFGGACVALAFLFAAILKS